MTAGNNAPAFLDLGAKAGDALKRGDSANSRGEAMAIVVLVEARNAAFEMTYATPRKEHKNGTVDRDAPKTFTLSTYKTELRSENAKIDSKAVSARKAALYASLFGLDTFTPAQDSIIARAIVSADYLCANNVVPELSSSGSIKVPHRLVFPAPKADASEAQKTIYDAMKDRVFSLDGREGYSLSNLRKMATPVKERAANSGQGNQDDAAKTFQQSLAFVLAIVEQCNNTGECSVAFKDSDLNKLTTLAAGIATLTHNENASVIALNKGKAHLSGKKAA